MIRTIIAACTLYSIVQKFTQWKKESFFSPLTCKSVFKRTTVNSINSLFLEACFDNGKTETTINIENHKLNRCLSHYTGNEPYFDLTESNLKFLQNDANILKRPPKAQCKIIRRRAYTEVNWSTLSDGICQHDLFSKTQLCSSITNTLETISTLSALERQKHFHAPSTDLEQAAQRYIDHIPNLRYRISSGDKHASDSRKSLRDKRVSDSRRTLDEICLETSSQPETISKPILSEVVCDEILRFSQRGLDLSLSKEFFPTLFKDFLHSLSSEKHFIFYCRRYKRMLFEIGVLASVIIGSIYIIIECIREYMPPCRRGHLNREREQQIIQAVHNPPRRPRPSEQEESAAKKIQAVYMQWKGIKEKWLDSLDPLLTESENANDPCVVSYQLRDGTRVEKRIFRCPITLLPSLEDEGTFARCNNHLFRASALKKALNRDERCPVCRT